VGHPIFPLCEEGGWRRENTEWLDECIRIAADGGERGLHSAQTLCPRERPRPTHTFVVPSTPLTGAYRLKQSNF
jgi:hypothetical protein